MKDPDVVHVVDLRVHIDREDTIDPLAYAIKDTRDALREAWRAVGEMRRALARVRSRGAR